MNVWRRLGLAGRIAVAAVVLLLLGTGAVLARSRFIPRAPSVSTFQVKRDEFLDVVQFRGQVKAMRSVTLSAPAQAGNLEIVKIVPNGSSVHTGDVIVEFDKSKTEHDLAQDRSTLKSSQAEIDQERAQDVLKEEEDATAVLKAQYDVESAKLEASKQAIVSKIDGSEANLKLADAQQKLHEVQVKLNADRTLDQAGVVSKKQASKKAEYDAQVAEHSLADMTLRAPSAGTISLIPVWHGDGENPFKAGENIWPGAPIAELPDASSLRVIGRVDETERGRVAVGQKVSVEFDAIPDGQFTGTVQQISTIATLDFSGGWPFPLNFNLQIALDQNDPRLKPAMTAQVSVVVDRVANAITIPAQAMFQRSGQTIAYVWDGSKFLERPISIARTSRDRVLVTAGLTPGDRVAMTDPTVKE